MKGVHVRFLVAFAAIGALASGCAGPPSSTETPRASSLAPLGAREAVMQAKVESRLRSGYYYQVTGHFQSVDVAVGKLPVFHAGPGDEIEIALVRAPEQKYRLKNATGNSRVASSLTNPPDCIECGGNGVAKPTPGPGPTPPPNYGPCSSQGGATWFNDATGAGGCTPPGNSQPLSCGSWTWSATAKGTLRVPGTGTFDNLDYVIDHGDGSCRLGTIR